MPNHFHLVVQTPNANSLAGMRRLSSACTLRLNHRHKPFGHLFSGRYKALLVDGVLGEQGKRPHVLVGDNLSGAWRRCGSSKPMRRRLGLCAGAGAWTARGSSGKGANRGPVERGPFWRTASGDCGSPTPADHLGRIAAVRLERGRPGYPEQRASVLDWRLRHD
jgi:hypothetical protein